MLPTVLALLLLAAAPAPAKSELSPEVERWVSSTAEQYRAVIAPLRPRLRAKAPGGCRGRAAPTLWRERPADTQLPAFTPPTSLAPLIRALRPGVVNISTVRQRAGGRSLGSGFILGPDGYVVTNAHVVDQAQQIEVKLADGREFAAQVVGQDTSTDVALLRLEGDFGALPFVYLGDSDALEVGDWVLAIGNPFGLDHSVSHGMISAKERVIGIGLFDDFIQTDALINPGNSGGPLFNMKGEVIGVNTAIISQGQGIGFAVPINMVKDLIPNLKVNGRLARGWLGVNIDEQLSGKQGRGAVVAEVFEGSPAARAGIKPGDRVLAVNGRTIETYQQLLRRVAILAPGSEAKLMLARAGKSDEVKVTLGQRPAQQPKVLAAARASRAPLGLVVQELDEAFAKSLGVPAYSGVLVAGVIPGGAAESAGLRAGDVIFEVNKRKVQDEAGLRAALAVATGEQLIRYRRGEATRYVALP